MRLGPRPPGKRAFPLRKGLLDRSRPNHAARLVQPRHDVDSTELALTAQQPPMSDAVPPGGTTWCGDCPWWG